MRREHVNYKMIEVRGSETSTDTAQERSANSAYTRWGLSLADRSDFCLEAFNMPIDVLLALANKRRLEWLWFIVPRRG